jgi:MYXO-CTERM domain-containing protein
MLTTPRRLAVLLFVFLAWAPAAYAWSWPVQGPVVQPFAYDEAHPYAAGQHRGIDIGADAAGETVVAPAAGTISFAGSVPTSGESVTIATADGYSVTLTHLGSITVGKGATVAEQDEIGTVGPSGTPEVDGPYVHLGIRVTADPNGYVDPLGLLPAAPETPEADSGSTASQPSSSPASQPSSSPASAAPAPSKPVSRAETQPARTARVSAHQVGRGQAPRADSRPLRSSQRPRSRADRATRTPHEPSKPKPQSHPSERESSVRRPVAQPAAPEPTGLAVGDKLGVTAPVAQSTPGRPDPLPGMVCNWVAALFAVGAALAAHRRRRRVDPTARVLHLPRSTADRRRLSRAA